MHFLTVSPGQPLQGFFSPLAGTDSYCIRHIIYENFPIADIAGVYFLHDFIDQLIRIFLRHNSFHLDFGKKVHSVLGSAVFLNNALLIAVTHNIHYIKAIYLFRIQNLFQILQLFGLNNDFQGIL